MKAIPRWLEKNLQGLKTREGIGSSAGLNPLLVATGRCPEQTPEGDASESGQLGQPGWRRLSPTPRGEGPSMRRYSWVAEKTPEE